MLLNCVFTTVGNITANVSGLCAARLFKINEQFKALRRVAQNPCYKHATKVMSREIKFEYGFESVNGIVKKKYYLHEIPNIKEKCDVWNVLPIKYVRQFTGKKDKNGIEIYEGDLIHVQGYCCEVVFEEGSFKTVYNHPEDGEILNIEDVSTELYSIIGNIYIQ